MREIKLKAFNTRTKQWYYFTIGEQWSDVQRALYSELCLQGATFYQFIGLKDKNGKEIYDQSSVKHNGTIYIVKWSKNQHGWVCKYKKSWRDALWMNRVSNYIEVIENPELLKV